jgi:ribosomal protein L11 methyltransferase
MAGVWRVSLTAPDAAAAEAALAALDAALGTVSVFESGEHGAWLVEGLSTARPDRGGLETRLALAWAERRDAPPDLAIERVVPRDWVAENQASFPSFCVGRYFVHGSHARARVPAERVGLLIDAATAFGTGEHGSTRGCLLALDRLARRRRFRRVLDMGTGTGILAVAAAKTWHRRVVARDIDAESARVARLNARANGVAHHVQIRRGAGYGDRWLKRAAPYDLVLANILARPIIEMARDLAHTLACDGVAVLSGLLPWQEAAVLAAHRRVGLNLARRISVEGWSTLIVARGAFPSSTDTDSQSP